MPMKMGVHCKPIGHSHSASLDSRARGNDGGMFFSRKRLIYGYPLKTLDFVCAPHEIKGFRKMEKVLICWSTLRLG